jgi:hypothetical protein
MPLFTERELREKAKSTKKEREPLKPDDLLFAVFNGDPHDSLFYDPIDHAHIIEKNKKR